MVRLHITDASPGRRANQLGRAPSRARARDHYQRAIAAQQAGDWARYGEELKQLGSGLEQLKEQ